MRAISPALGCVLLLAFSSHAQTLKSDSTLAWPGCVSLALKNSPELSSSGYSVKASESSYQGSRNGFSPQINLSQSYLSPSNRSGWVTNGSVSMNVFDKSETATARTARTLVSQTQAGYQATSSLVRFNLRTAFAQLLFAQRDVDASRRIAAMRKEASQLVTLRYNSGRESKGNRMRADAQLSLAEAALTQSQRNVRTAQENLCRQMGLDGFFAYKADSIPVAPPPPEPSIDSAALNRRADIASQQRSVETAEALLAQAKSTEWPKLSVGYSQYLYGFTSPDYGLNVLLSYPLFANGLTRAHYAARTAMNNLEKAKQDLRAVREQARVDIQAAWSDFSGAMDQIKVQGALLAAARQRNEEADIRYNSGLLTYDNWEIIASDRIAQERETILAQLRLMDAEAAWDKAQGRQLKDESP